MNRYPVALDERFSHALVIRVAEVFEDAGYPTVAGDDHVMLAMLLYRFLYGKKELFQALYSNPGEPAPAPPAPAPAPPIVIDFPRGAQLRVEHDPLAGVWRWSVWLPKATAATGHDKVSFGHCSTAELAEQAGREALALLVW